MITDIRTATKNISVGLRGNMRWDHMASNGRLGWIIGYAFRNNNFMNSNALLKLFLKNAEMGLSACINLVKELNGNFAIIIKAGNEIFVSMDKIRSYPLFYSLRDNTFLISDNAHIIKDRLKLNSLNQNAVKEFFTSGYVSGGETLFADIKQLRAGECMCFSPEKESALKNVPTKRYYTYYNKRKFDLGVEEMIETYDGILFGVFKRILESAGDRKIVVPLSGGVDSRLVASMLKKVGYENVLCISYGTPNNWQTKISKKVAMKLGYKWKYIPYIRRKWYDSYRTREFKDFFYSYDNFSSISNVDDWLAIRELKLEKAIPQDAIFVPGHTGDFISGGHLQYIFGKKQKRITREHLLEDILKKHYNMWSDKLAKPEIKNYLMNKLSKFFEYFPLDSEQAIADAYECWEWQERQAKFIINSVRTCDFWGYEWRLPLWDSEMMNFWSAVPYNFKLDKKLYLLHQEKKDEFKSFGKNLRRKRLYKKSFISQLRKFYEYFTDTKAIYGIYNYFAVTFLNIDRKNEHSILIKDYLKNIGSKVAA